MAESRKMTLLTLIFLTLWSEGWKDVSICACKECSGQIGLTGGGLNVCERLGVSGPGVALS